MYIDVIIIVALIIVSFCWFRKFSKMVYAVGIIDIFFRLIIKLQLQTNFKFNWFYRTFFYIDI